MSDKNAVGKNIRAFREASGKTQQQIAEAASIQTTQLSTYETGSRLPNIDTLARIAKALDKSIDELYYGKGTNTSVQQAASYGHQIVDSIVLLFNYGVIGEVIEDAEITDSYRNRVKFDAIELNAYLYQINRLIRFLCDFRRSRDTFSDPEGQLRGMCESVAKEIDPEEEIPF